MKTQILPHVLFVKNRINRPQVDINLTETNNCPFCPGHEDQTPPEIDRVEERGNWKIRVFSNKYPITPVHEVIVNTTDHHKTLTQLSDNELTLLLSMYQKRINAHAAHGIVFLFCNEGKAAGSSIAHSHSQLILIDETSSISFFEPLPVENVIQTHEELTMYCPTRSVYPYEVWITHPSVGFNAMSQTQLTHLAHVLKSAIQSLQKKLGTNLAYNYYILPTSPFFMRIIPRTTVIGSFELATNTYVNSVSADEAARALKQS